MIYILLFDYESFVLLRLVALLFQQFAKSNEYHWLKCCYSVNCIIIFLMLGLTTGPLNNILIFVLVLFIFL